MKLKYTGNGKHITSIPARDLDQNDLDRLIDSGLFVSVEDAITALTKSGVYTEVKKTTPKKKETDTVEDKDDA